MLSRADGPKVNPGSLVTIAFLKAKLDEGSDHLGIFVPLLIDAICSLNENSFVVVDVQAALVARHSLAMPQPIIETLLKRLAGKRYLRRQFGRFIRTDTFPNPSNIDSQKATIEHGQARLADALIAHAASRGVVLESSEKALEALFKFLDQEQVTVLLRDGPAVTNGEGASKYHRIVAEFIQDVVENDPTLRGVLNAILQGLVLYQAAFLPDINAGSRRFKDVAVYFDSNLVRQALGYEGDAVKLFMRETVDVLKAEGVRCLVFEKTVAEIQRILERFEELMATSHGRDRLRPTPMSRHFLTERYSPSDIREMSALLEIEIARCGFRISRTPSRIPAFTSDEKALAERIADPKTKDEVEPRVVHDVDCVAAVLTLRGGHYSSLVEEVRAIFATSSSLLVRNVRLWYEDVERGIGVPPIIHVRALANLAWLKRPKLATGLQEREIIALCAAALRPSQDTWQRFLKHLNKLEKRNELSSDEMTAILVSAMSDRLLREAELDEGGDLDAVTLDDVVYRVKSEYTERYEAKLAEQVARTKAESARADEAQRTAAEAARERAIAIEGRARSWAKLLANVGYWIVATILIVGAVAAIAAHPFHSGWIGVAIGIPVLLYLAIEFFGGIRHVSDFRSAIELRLIRWFRRILSAGVDEGL